MQRVIGCRVAALAGLGLILLGVTVSGQVDPGQFVNWETPHVSPLALTPDGDTLLAVNTADGRLEVFDVTSGTAVLVSSIPVGLDPVSVRPRTSTEIWVVNQISDTISVVDLGSGHVVATLATDDEPADVVFAGQPARAFVSCSQANRVLVYDPADLAAAPLSLEIRGEDPRAMAVSADGAQVYVAVFESGNGTTILGGGMTAAGTFPPNVVNDPAGPYLGVNPPPNDGAGFDPPLNPGLGVTPPEVGLIVRQAATGEWLDDNGQDWSDLVDGPGASASGRLPGWTLLDHDVAVIDASTLAVTYLDRLMNICAQLAVRPGTGEVTVVGSEAINEVRFEPKLKGVFARMHMAWADPSGAGPAAIVDLNPHLDYSTGTIAQSLRDESIGDPRGIVWNSTGNVAYVSGKGSNNVIQVNGTGQRTGSSPVIEVGQGPTGLAFDEPRNRLYVLNHFSASVSVIDTVAEAELEQVAFHDPTPTAIRQGRPHLYDTHRTSGLGQLSCASCHIDGRMDRLAWDLGDPSGEMKPFNQNCLDACDDWHPMKGPMTTQTLQDIIGKEPHHWRGDRDGIEEFDGAFLGLLGDDEGLTPAEMQQFEDFLATITFPPNPFRNLDNSLPDDLPLPGHYTTGRFAPAGFPLPNGNAVVGLELYRTDGLDGVFNCVSCHTLPTGMGGNGTLGPAGLTPIPAGPNGEAHLFLTGSDGSTNRTMKVPHLRNLYDKVGFELTQLENTAGFGYLHDGSVDSLARFVNQPFFGPDSDQETADLVAFLLAFSGSDLPVGSMTSFLEALGPDSLDTHAAVGVQWTVNSSNQSSPETLQALTTLEGLAASGDVGLVAKGIVGGLPRGYLYTGAGMLQSDRAGETTTIEALRLGVAPGAAVTFTIVASNTETRMGLDRDGDGFFDRDEIDVCSDPAHPAITPAGTSCSGTPFVRGDCNGDGGLDIGDPISLLGVLFSMAGSPICPDACDPNDDGAIDIADGVYLLANLFNQAADPLAPFPVCGDDATADALDCAAYVCP